MARKNKKRTKRYTGEDARTPQTPAQSQPVVHHYEAADRGAVGQWWFDKKRTVKIVSGATGIVVLVGWLLFELFRILL